MHTCIPLHRLKRSWHLCPRWVNAGNRNKPSMHHTQRRNVATSMVGLKMVTYAKISPKMVNPRDIAGEHRRRRIMHLVNGAPGPNEIWFKYKPPPFEPQKPKSLYPERRQLTWPQGADLPTKLWGSAEDLYWMAGFVASTRLKIWPAQLSIAEERRRRNFASSFLLISSLVSLPSVIASSA